MALVEHLPGPVLRRLLVHVLDDPGNRGRGLPDLLLYRPGRLELIEIKGLGDQLRPAQVQWLLRLRKAGVQARVLRVAWAAAVLPAAEQGV